MKIARLLLFGFAACSLAAAQKPAVPPAPAAAPPAPAAAPALPAAPAPAPVPLTLVGQDVVYYGGNTWLGVSLADLDAERAKQLHLASADGAEVKEVFPNSPAAAAGIKPGDVIVRFHGQPVISVRELTRMVGDELPDRTVQVGLVRHGQPLSVEVRIGRRHAGEGWPGLNVRIPPMPKMPPMPRIDVAVPAMPEMMSQLDALANEGANGGGSLYFRMLSPEGASLGVAVEQIPAQLAHYFGATGEHAILVRSVAAGGIGDSAGLKAGDVILSVAGAKVSTVEEFYSALRQHVHEKVALQILRKGQTSTIEIPALAPHLQGAAKEAWPAEAKAAAAAERQAYLASLAAEKQALAAARAAVSQYRGELEAARPKIEAAARLERSKAMQAVREQLRELQRQLEQVRRQARGGVVIL
ncbi:MAG TPA: PDZ domain-containing protein [Terriglobales bacterium]|nr:PDZ domain-containing protein [Terriglobales bacterium]